MTRMEGKKRTIGIIVLSVLGIVTGLLSFFLGLIGAGPFSIIFGGIWIFLGLRLWRFQKGIRKAILIVATLFLLAYFSVFYLALAVDRFYGVGLVLQFPLAVLNIIAMIYLLLPKVKKSFQQQ